MSSRGPQPCKKVVLWLMAPTSPKKMFACFVRGTHEERQAKLELQVLLQISGEQLQGLHILSGVAWLHLSGGKQAQRRLEPWNTSRQKKNRYVMICAENPRYHSSTTCCSFTNVVFWTPLSWSHSPNQEAVTINGLTSISRSSASFCTPGS